MTPDEMRAGLLKAFELLTYGSPDREMHNKTGITKWIDDCDAWLDKFAPSRVRLPDEPTGDDEARITEMNIKAKAGEPMEATACFEGGPVKAFAASMVNWFRETGGKNYVTCDLRDPETGESYQITMQKAGGRTPAQDLVELRAQVNR